MWTQFKSLPAYYNTHTESLDRACTLKNKTLLCQTCGLFDRLFNNDRLTEARTEFLNDTTTDSQTDFIITHLLTY